MMDASQQADVVAGAGASSRDSGPAAEASPAGQPLAEPWRCARRRATAAALLGSMAVVCVLASLDVLRLDALDRALATRLAGQRELLAQARRVAGLIPTPGQTTTSPSATGRTEPADPAATVTAQRALSPVDLPSLAAALERAAGEAGSILVPLDWAQRLLSPDLARPPSAQRLGAAWREAAGLAGAAAIEEAGGARASTGVGPLVQQGEQVEARLNQLAVNVAEVARRLTRGDAKPDQIHMATRQLALIERIHRSVSRLAVGATSALGAIDRAGRDTIVLGEVNNALLVGSPELRLERVTDDDVRSYLELIGRDFRSLAVEMEALFAKAGSAPAEVESQASPLASLRLPLGAAHGALAELERAARTVARARWVSWGTLQWVGLAVVAAWAWLLFALYRDARQLMRQAAVAAEQAGADAAERESLGARLDANQQAAELATQAMTASVWRLIDGEFAKPSAREPLDPDFARAIESLASRLRTGLGEMRDAARKMHSATGLLGEATGNLEAVSGDGVRGLRDARGVGELMSESSAGLLAEARGLTEAARRDLDAAGRAVNALAEADEELRAGAGAIEEINRAIKVVAESAGGIKEMLDRSDELGDRARMLALNLSLRAGEAGEAGAGAAWEQAAEELTRMAEGAVGLGRAAAAVREAVVTDADAALRAARRAGAALERVGGRSDTARGAIEQLLTRLRAAQAQVEGLSGTAREQQAELRRHVHVLTELAARAEQSRSGAGRVSGAAQRLGELARILEQRSEALLSVSRDGGTVVHLTATSADTPRQPGWADAPPDEAGEAFEFEAREYEAEESSPHANRAAPGAGPRASLADPD